MARPRPALLVLGAGALALGIGTVGIAVAGSGLRVDSVGERPAVSTPATSSTVQAAPTAESAYRSVARVDATTLPRPDESPRPTEISIPAIDIRIPVEVVGLDSRNQVEVPRDVRRTGWYQFSAKPGTGAGSTVIVGHVDGVDQGAGAFYRLGEVNPGDTVTLTREDDSRVTYRVTARETFAKDRVPLRELFSRAGPERLTLITCGGPFDPASLEYTDNIVVTAVPVDSAADLGETR